MAIARPHLILPVQDNEGDIELNYAVRFLVPGSTTLVPNTLYASRTGATVIEQPFDVPNGVVDVYFDEPTTVRVGITPPGQTEFFLEDVDIQPVATQVLIGDGPMYISGTPEAGSSITATSSNTGEWVAPAASSSNPTVGFVVDNSGDMRAGANSAVGGGNSLAIGTGADASGAASVAIGDGATASGKQSIAIGDGATVAQDYTAEIAADVLRVGPSPSSDVGTALSLFDSSGVQWYLTVDTGGHLLTSLTPPAA